jgi:hypothetical protein
VNETEKLTVGVLVGGLALLVPGFLLHVSPRFPGSLTGSLIGIAGAVLLLFLLVYSMVKRSAWVKAWVTKYVRMGAILSFHIYAGVIGALLGIIHSGHTFYSPLGIGLVSAMLVVVFSGFVGRYYLVHLGTMTRSPGRSPAVLLLLFGRTRRSPACSVPSLIWNTRSARESC